MIFKVFKNSKASLRISCRKHWKTQKFFARKDQLGWTVGFLKLKFTYLNLKKKFIPKMDIADLSRGLRISEFRMQRLRNGPAGRNSPCPCKSGKKFKNCCWDKEL